MSSNGSYNSYTMRLGIGSPNNQTFVFIEWGSGYGATDQFILDVATALKGVTTPAGTTLDVSVTKSAIDATDYTADLSTTPPTFT